MNPPTALEPGFLELARRGKNAWWRYLLSALLMLFLLLAGSLAAAVALLVGQLFTSGFFPKSIAGGNPMDRFDPLLLVTVTLLSFLPLLAGLLLSVRFIHGRSITSLITPLARVDWKRIAIGCLVFGVLVGLADFVEALLHPGRYQLTFAPIESLKFLPVVLVLVPIQAATEELLFRGYLMQSLGLLTRRTWVPVLASSLLFMLLHFSNPEAQVDTVLALAGYGVAGLLFALVAIKDNQLELAIGMHIANNAFVLLVNSTVSALPVKPVFTVTAIDAAYNLVSLVLIGLLFYAGLAWLKRQPAHSRL